MSKTRKPALTRRALCNMLSVASMAQADADLMDGATKQEREHRAELCAGCDYIRKLAHWWADHHDGKWPTEADDAKEPANGDH